MNSQEQKKRPPAKEIVRALMDEFDASHAEVLSWILESDFSGIVEK